MYDLEQFGHRPMTEFQDNLRRELVNFRPTVTFYAAASQPGELPFRMALRVFLLQELKVRHGHMPGITPQLMIEGMRADYKVVAALTRAVYDLGRETRTIRVTTPDGTDLTALISPHLRWVPSTGIYHEQGQWGNLPEGETFTCPETLDGTLVAHILGDYFSEKYGVLEHPSSSTSPDGRVTAVESKNHDVAIEITEYLDSSENGRRAGEFAIGTNIGLKKLTGQPAPGREAARHSRGLRQPVPARDRRGLDVERARRRDPAQLHDQDGRPDGHAGRPVRLRIVGRLTQRALTPPAIGAGIARSSMTLSCLPPAAIIRKFSLSGGTRCTSFPFLFALLLRRGPARPRTGLTGGGRGPGAGQNPGFECGDGYPRPAGNPRHGAEGVDREDAERHSKGPEHADVGHPGWLRPKRHELGEAGRL